jgi:hypothetical protein
MQRQVWPSASGRAAALRTSGVPTPSNAVAARAGEAEGTHDRLVANPDSSFLADASVSTAAPHTLAPDEFHVRRTGLL